MRPKVISYGPISRRHLQRPHSSENRPVRLEGLLPPTL